ncbi:MULTISPECIES: ribonuclease Z [Sanguibacteroides]|uniref:Ribonuclease Z n=1 Tax=Sanguibacteroides justesenii TaxID=1547597 RepID=A0A0C3RD68_9PORP|nr:MULTISPECIES: ribonuclease Z [Sanguibacteroides]KIO44126.1 ribonuclease Z [Sanguibacteroides justesenii]KIO47216.1 ribonuclease Z [Sanguibacteroides justesenii]PXZ43843.1 ribonuclease Z [Sanguibacteroides justesenii]
MKFELTILGCGSAVPTLQRNAAAQVLNVLERYFLIDCGEGTQHQLRRFKVPYNKINRIFISHLHGDHFFGLIGLLSTFSMQNRRGELHVYADKRLQEIIEFQLKLMNSRLNYPLIFHHLGREPELIYEDKLVTVRSFPLKHRYEAPANGFLFAEKERPRSICREMAEAFQVPVAFMHRLKEGEDFITSEGEIIPNERLTASPPAPRSYAYMTDTLFRESFAEYVRGVDLLYHDATYGDEFADLAKATYHSTATQAARMAVLAGTKRLLLGHFSSRYIDPSPLLEQARIVFPDTELSKDGAVFEIPLIKRSRL